MKSWAKNMLKTVQTALGDKDDPKKAAPKPAAATSGTATPPPAGAAAATAAAAAAPAAAGHADSAYTEAELAAERARMLTVHAAAEATEAPRHVTRARELEARLAALPPPRPPLVPLSAERLLINRHERLIEDARQLPIYGSGLPTSDVTRVLACTQTSDMREGMRSLVRAQELSDRMRQTTFSCQLLKSMAATNEHQMHKITVALAECDALHQDVSGGGSAPTAAPTIVGGMLAGRATPPPPVPPLTATVAAITDLVKDIDALLTDEDRAAIAADMKPAAKQQQSLLAAASE